ncbi:MULTISPECIES: hypothetical protein [Novosphingobium]|nr:MULTISPECIES: hypothetical protein [Novosphingobium]GFM30133.1 uncharacterized protein PY1_contig-08-712 [Novosphingobium sp. PY1]
MKTFRSRIAVSLAAAAALSMTATPVFARGYGDWRGYRHHHHDRGLDGGDVLAGLLIVGGIAAIASAASKSARDKQVEEPSRYPGGPDYDAPEDRGYGDVPREERGNPRDYPEGARSNESFDDMVASCADEIERGERRIDTVDNVARMGERYSVEGRLEDGREFACSIDREGRVRSVAVDGHALI